LEEIGIPELTSEQVERLCEIGEETARKYILSKVPLRRVSVLNITVDIEGTKPITVNVDVEVTLSPLMKNYDVKKLTAEATKMAFDSIERYLRELSCKSTK
jgi:acid phosphatase class B